MVVLLSFMNGHPNGRWYLVRNYFVQGARYNVTLSSGQRATIMVPSNAKVIHYITSIIGTWYGEQKLIQGINISGNNKVYTFTSQNANIEVIFVIER